MYKLLIQKYIALFISASLLTITSSSTYAAFCSLRDPVETIQKLYPESTSFKSSVKVIDESIRDQVQTLLPPNTLHFSELGKHTLYIAFKGKDPLGYVHVRSEESDWGLVEIAWAITLDMEVRDFKFQRCRSRQKRTIEDESFRTQLRGRTFDEFTHMLMPDGKSLNPEKISVKPKAKSLAEIVIICGMKTLLVTRLAWEKEVTQYRNQYQANAFFDDVDSTETLVSPINSTISTILNKAFDGASTGMDHQSISVTKVYDSGKQVLGMIYEGKLSIDNTPTQLTWVIDTKGTIIHVSNNGGWQDASTQKAFEKVVGKSYNTTDECNNRADLLSLEAVLTTRSLLSL